MSLFDLEGGAAVRTLRVSSEQGSGLLYDKMVLEGLEKLFRGGEGHAEVLHALAVVLEGRDFLHLFLPTIVHTDHALPLPLHGEPSSLG
jgi:hypothetical protein